MQVPLPENVWFWIDSNIETFFFFLMTYILFQAHGRSINDGTTMPVSAIFKHAQLAFNKETCIFILNIHLEDRTR